MNRWLSLLLSLLILPALAQERDANQESTPMIHLNVEQLPDLNIPRAGHQVFCDNGEFVVAGGHTDGFVSTALCSYILVPIRRSNKPRS